MAELNFPDPQVTNPWPDPNGTIWDHDGDGWLARGKPTDIYQEATPDPTLYAVGQGWVRTSDMIKFQMYADADSKQWVQVGSMASAAFLTGFKNVLINSDHRVNQRNFDGNWAGLSTNAFGYDRWRKRSGGVDKYQLIEVENMIDGETYTLSWDGGGVGEFRFQSGSIVISGASPLTFVCVLEGALFPWVNVPTASTNMQLERGAVATPFELRSMQQELALCQRYYYQTLGPDNIAYYYSAGNNAMFSNSWPFPVTMRIIPIIVEITAGTYTNCSLQDYTATEDGGLERVVVSGTGRYRSRLVELSFDAEL